MLFDKLESEIPDIVIADIDMPGMNGLELCKEICEKKLGPKVIMLTMYNDHEILKLAFLNGAKGYLVKDNTSEELVDCISYALDGKTYIAKSIQEQQQLYDGQDQNDLHIAEMLSSLTRTELKTLKLVAQKLSSKEIADLFLSPSNPLKITDRAFVKNSIWTRETIVY